MIRRLLLTLGLCAVMAPARAELTICNRTSYLMDTAFGLEKRAMVSTRGWFRIEPGQCRQVLDGALDADMVYVHSRTPEVYGNAPRPRLGGVELCVRPTDFTIADARSCPLSQQVHFSVARPTDSPRGPAINLAEEADYDDTQAKLAGIQRLLTIAGYDAYPIDGVQGAKTQGALSKFIADHGLAADAASAPDFVATLLKAAENPQGHGFAWCNDTPFTVMASVGTAEAGTIVTRGWYRVAAGQCLRPDVRGDVHKLFSYGEAVDADGRTIKRGEGPLSWGGKVALCTRDGKYELSDQRDCAARGLNSDGFAAIDVMQPATIVRFKE